MSRAEPPDHADEWSWDLPARWAPDDGAAGRDAPPADDGAAVSASWRPAPVGGGLANAGRVRWRHRRTPRPAPPEGDAHR